MLGIQSLMSEIATQHSKQFTRLQKDFSSTSGIILLSNLHFLRHTHE